MNKSSNIPQAIEQIRQGRIIILFDDEHRENEGDFIMAADKVTPEAINFMTRYGSGVICMPMLEDDLQRLNIPMMPRHNRSKFNTAFTLSIEAATGVTTGISAADRARTIQVAVDPNSTPDDVAIPGHIFPLRGHKHGVLARMGHTEGTIDLARLAGLRPAGVLCEVMNPDGTMARMPDLKRFAEEHDMLLVSMRDLIDYRLQTEIVVEEVAASRLPTIQNGEFTIKAFINKLDGIEHLALVHGEIDPAKPVLVRLHSECLTGDLFGSSRCDCGWQLQTAMARLNQEGGVLLYLRQEGRGIGLHNKIKAYALQDEGLDTIEANEKLGFAADQRDYWLGAHILRSLGINKIRLMTNNPQKVEALNHYGVDVVTREPLISSPTEDNIRYLQAKQKKLGHLLDLGRS